MPATSLPSVVRLQVHAGIEAGNLVGVAVEGQGGVAAGGEEATFADPPFARLAPARMVDCGIDVGIKSVLSGIACLPGVERLLVGQRDADDRLDALEALFPRNNEPDRRTVL